MFGLDCGSCYDIEVSYDSFAKTIVGESFVALILDGERERERERAYERQNKENYFWSKRRKIFLMLMWFLFYFI